MADPKTTEMPGGEMADPPKGKKKPTEMPSGEMGAPPQIAEKAGAAKGGPKKGGAR